MRIVVKFLVPNQHGTLTYRRDLSRTLQKALGVPRFFKNFGTKNKAEALPLYLKYHSEVEEQIKAALSGAQIVSVEQAAAIADRWYLEASKADRASRHVTNYPEDPLAKNDEELNGFSIYSTNASVIAAELEMGNLDIVAKETEDALRLSGVFLPRGSNNWRRVAAAVGAKVVRHLLRQEARGAGDWSEADKPVQSIGVPLIELKDRWARTQRNTKTVDEATKAVDEFIALVGPISADKITTKNIADYRDDRLANGKKPQTVIKKIGFLKTIIERGIEDGLLVGANPAASVRVIDNVLPADKREPFSVDELTTIFSQPLFTRGELPKARKAGGSLAFWLPLIFLFSGIRPNEIAQLRREDFWEEGELFGVTISGKVKTAAARRRLPIHEELIRIGIRRYVEAIPSGSIFPDMVVKENGNNADYFSDWFGRWKRGLGITSDKKVLYSLRHNFTQAATEAELPDPILQTLIGHSHTNVLNKTYRKGFPISVLKAALDKIAYPKLDLSGVVWRLEGGGDVERGFAQET